MTRSRTRPALVAGASLFTASTAAFAFEACPAGTRPCAAPAQVLFYGVLPSIAMVLLAIFVKRRVQSAWLRRTAMVLLTCAWGAGALILLAAFGAFLAPCAAVCWYG